MSAAEIVFVALGLGATIALGWWVGRPLVESGRPVTEDEGIPADLLLQQAAAVADLKDLDGYRSAGRIDHAEYALRRAQVVGSGAAALAGLDRWAASRRELVASRLARVESDVATLRRQSDVSRCHACGHTVAAFDRYCRTCGSELPSRDGDGRLGPAIEGGDG